MLPGKTFRPEDLLALALKHWLMLLVLPVVFGLLAAAASLGIPNKYRSETLILVVPQRIPESYVRSTVTMPIESRLKSISQQLLSRTRLERIIQDFDLYPSQRRKRTMEEVVVRMRDDVEVEIVRGDSFRVSYVSRDPRLAKAVTERLAGLFIDENLRDRGVLAEGTSDFLETQMEEARRRLIDHEKKLEAYRRIHAGELPSQLTSNNQAMQNFQLQIQALLDTLNRDRDRRDTIRRDIDSLPMLVVETPSVPARAGSGPDAWAPQGGSAAQRLEAAVSSLQALQLRLRPEHPDVIRLQRAIEELTKDAEAKAATHPVAPATAALRPDSNVAVKAATRVRLQQLTVELDNINKEIVRKEAEEQRVRASIVQYQARIEQTPARESELVELMRDYDTLQGTYRSLLGKKQESQIAANLERQQVGEQFKILDPARVPQKAFSPNRRLISAAGIGLGFMLGIAVVGLAAYRDNTFVSGQDIVTALSLPVLATIPLLVVNPAGIRRRHRKLAFVIATGTVLLTVAVLTAWRLKLLERLTS